MLFFFFFQAEDGIRDIGVTGVQTCALPILPLEEAALFGCAVLTGVGAVVNTARVPAGASVAVVGLGGVGLAALLGAAAAGSRRIVAVDLSDDKPGLARQTGATDTVNSRDPDAA